MNPLKKLKRGYSMDNNASPNQTTTFNLHTEMKNNLSPGPAAISQQDNRAYLSTSSSDGNSSSSSENPKSKNNKYESLSLPWSDPQFSPIDILKYLIRKNAHRRLNNPLWIWASTDKVFQPAIFVKRTGGQPDISETKTPEKPSSNSNTDDKLLPGIIRVPAVVPHEGFSYLFPKNPNNPIYVEYGKFIGIVRYPHPLTHKIDTSAIIRVYHSITSIWYFNRMLATSSVIASRATMWVIYPEIFPKEFKPAVRHNDINFTHDMEIAGTSRYMTVISHRPDPEKYPDNTVSYVHSLYCRNDGYMLEKFCQFYKKKNQLVCVVTYNRERCLNRIILEVKKRWLAAKAAKAAEAAKQASKEASNPNINSTAQLKTI